MKNSIQNDKLIENLNILEAAKLNKTASCLLILKYHLNLRDLDKKDEDGNTPLHYACINKNKTIALALCQAGACPFIANKLNTSPSDYPFFKNDKDVSLKS